MFATHAAVIAGSEVDGIGDNVNATLEGMKRHYLHLKHYLNGERRSAFYEFNQGFLSRSGSFIMLRKPSLARYLGEILATVAFALRKKNRAELFIGVDPLNAFSGLMLRKLGLTKAVIFYTADYDPKRFQSRLLNGAYHAIDSYCVAHADEVWSVSSRICAVRSDMDLPDKKNIFVPNAPTERFARVREQEERRQHALVISGTLDVQLDFSGLIAAVAKLKTQYPDITLDVIGSGPLERELKTLSATLGVTEYVTFWGRVPLERSLEITSKAGVGLSPYTGAWTFNYYGDSTKCREFLNFGLPVLTTDSHSTAQEIERDQAGVIVTAQVHSYVEGIANIFENYSLYSANAERLGAMYRGHRERNLLRWLEG